MHTIALALMFAACDLGKLFAPAEAWQEGAVDFVVEHADDGFKFASQKRDIVNCMKRGMVTWHGLEVWEARLYYLPSGLQRIEMSLYNRGDDKDGEGMTDAKLNALLAAIAEKAEPGGKLGRPERKGLKSGGSQYTRDFDKADPRVLLTWGVSEGKSAERRTEFVRVTLSPKAANKPRGVTKVVSGRDALAKIKSNVTKNEDGDVWIRNVPMVDQGQKGYCAAATSERILRYYGHNIDEHEIAQMAGTEAKGGTSTSEMIETVKTIGSKCRLGYQEIVMMVGGVGDIEEDIRRYNKAAKAEKKPELKMSDFLSGSSIDVRAIKEAMEPKVIKKMRVKDSRYRKFLTGIKTRIDQGIPVFWGVTLGIFPEPGLPQTMGGHMRLIIGYNPKTKEILYSDTWGAGHELKRMPEEWAFAITDNAFSLKPL